MELNPLTTSFFYVKPEEDEKYEEDDCIIIEDSSESDETSFTIIEETPKDDEAPKTPPNSNFLTDPCTTAYYNIKTFLYGALTVSSIIPHKDKIPFEYQHLVKKLIEHPSEKLSNKDVHDWTTRMRQSKNINYKWELLMGGIFENSPIDHRLPSKLIQDYLNSKNIFDENIIFIPFVYKGNYYIRLFYNSAHIVIITIDRDNKKIEYYDSLAYPLEDRNAYNEFSMKEDLEKVKKICFDDDNEAEVVTNSLKQQYDCHSCGVFVLNFIKKRLEGRSFKEITETIMNSQDIQRIRIELACYLSEPKS